MKHILYILVFLIFSGCTPGKVSTTWKSDQLYRPTYNRILVVAIDRDSTDKTRRVVEQVISAELTGLGYESISSFEKFGAHGLSGMNDIATYQKLCDNGIDAIITMALTDDSYDSLINKTDARFTNINYYNRIWNYSQLESRIVDDNAKVYWECMLFDLAQLKPAAVMRSEWNKAKESIRSADEVAISFTRKLQKEKIIHPKNASKKAF